MKIGVFDSGLGGLFTMAAIVKKIPKYDYVYLGDTMHLPYGNRKEAEIYRFLRDAVAYLFKKDCTLVIVACNTASAQALRRLQREYLPKHFPARRVLGVIVPNIEEAMRITQSKHIGILGTFSTIQSKTYPREFKKIDPRVKVYQQSAPLLVPMIESGEYKKIDPILKKYLAPLLKHNIDTLILACTHYPIIKKEVRAITGKKIRVICQDEFKSEKLKSYLTRHPEIENLLSKKHKREFLVTKKTQRFEILAQEWFGKEIKLKKVSLAKTKSVAV